MILRWMFHHAGSIAKWLMLGLLLYAVAGFLGSLVPLPGERRAVAGTQIFVVSNGVHTDFCLPIQHPLMDWRGLFPPETLFPGREVKYLSFGWGDRAFFLETPRWSDLKAQTALKAVFAPSKAALHLTPWSQQPQVHTQCRQLFLSDDQYKRLCAYLLQTIPLHSEGLPLLIGQGYGGGDLFFEANGRYHLFQTCNEWTSRGLHEAGIQTAFWAPFARSVMIHLP